jgi:redox-sensitive bicupin YhaK (pirin superfamily)
LPLQEPVARYGPFVMNTEDEIREAYEEYSRGNPGGNLSTMLLRFGAIENGQ